MAPQQILQRDTHKSIWHLLQIIYGFLGSAYRGLVIQTTEAIVSNNKLQTQLCGYYVCE